MHKGREWFWMQCLSFLRGKLGSGEINQAQLFRKRWITEVPGSFNKAASASTSPLPLRCLACPTQEPGAGWMLRNEPDVKTDSWFYLAHGWLRAGAVTACLLEIPLSSALGSFILGERQPPAGFWKHDFLSLSDWQEWGDRNSGLSHKMMPLLPCYSNSGAVRATLTITHHVQNSVIISPCKLPPLFPLAVPPLVNSITIHGLT